MAMVRRIRGSGGSGGWDLLGLAAKAENGGEVRFFEMDETWFLMVSGCKDINSGG